MKPITIERFSSYFARQAELNNLPFNVLAKKFNVIPLVQQTLYEKLRESSEFLGTISLVL